ncbi:hypothetical protein AGMMS49593_06700 [Endomicrobiia bacterium]|nr:hypothetical protein AGMMS49593_06700 [Endomicrobiia bacterium]
MLKFNHSPKEIFYAFVVDIVGVLKYVRKDIGNTLKQRCFNKYIIMVTDVLIKRDQCQLVRMLG